MSITKHTGMKEVAELINDMLTDVTSLQSNIQSLNTTLTSESNKIINLENKFNGESAKNSELLSGHGVNELVFKKDMIGLTTQIINPTEREVTITYNTTDGITKEVNVNQDTTIKFEIDTEQKTISIPTSIILFNVTNKAIINFTNIVFVDGVEIPTLVDSDYKLLVDITYIGTNWFIKDIKVITDTI